MARLARYWIFGPVPDLTLVLLTPLAILLAFSAAEHGGWLDGLVAFALALAMAHYFPGILRAYGDRSLFRRYRIRLIAAPVCLLSGMIVFAYLNLNFVFLLTGVWGAWHWMMQVYGFARIYDSKVKSTGRAGAWLDRLMCLFWFGTSVFAVNDVLPVYVTRFYQSGGPPLPAQPFSWFTRGWLAVTLILTVVYLVHAARAARRGHGPNPLKFVLIGMTFLYLSYTASMIDRPIVGYAMFEAWHDIQYLAIVWVFSLNRTRQNSEQASFMRFLFRPRTVLVFLYVSMCLAFGSLTHAWRLFENPVLIRVIAAIVPAAAFFHYYLDGFIWRIREEQTREALGIRSSPDREIPQSVRFVLWPGFFPAWIRHAALWLLFLVPASVLFVMESQAHTARPALQVYENLVQTFPDSANARYELAGELQRVGRLREAKVHFERALELSPDSYRAMTRLGALLVDQGNFAAARPYLERALKIDPADAEVHNNLGVVLDELGELGRARSHLEQAVSLNPDYALGHNNLGMVLVKLGHTSEARAQFEQALRIQPDYRMAQENLSRLAQNQAR